MILIEKMFSKEKTRPYRRTAGGTKTGRDLRQNLLTSVEQCRTLDLKSGPEVTHHNPIVRQFPGGSLCTPQGGVSLLFIENNVWFLKEGGGFLCLGGRQGRRRPDRSLGS